jgi:transcriptional regulator with XRE-family HTH domain
LARFLSSTKLPATLPGRIEYTGRGLYGRRWRTALATALGISRVTLDRWLRGFQPQSNVDVELLSLLAKERAARAVHGITLDRMCREFNNLLES